MRRAIAKAVGGTIAAWALAATPAGAVTICAWMDETIGEDDYHELKLWLEADGEFEGYYMLKGEGLSAEGMKAHSPSSGTFFLRPRARESYWGFGATLTPPGKIDVIVEVRAKPADIFAEEPPPLLASFGFRRDIPEGETTPPRTLATKQCAAVAAKP